MKFWKVLIGWFVYKPVTKTPPPLLVMAMDNGFVMEDKADTTPVNPEAVRIRQQLLANRK